MRNVVIPNLKIPMNKIILFFIALITSMSMPAFAQQDSTQVLQTLEQELESLETKTALLVPSQGVDYYPTWSPNGKKLGANVMGTWYEINLDNLALVEANWRDNQKLGVLNSNSSVSESENAEAWFDSTRFNPRKIETSSGVLIELAPKGLGVKFKISEPDTTPVELWQSRMENCHNLALSPDQSKVAFICEMNGIFVYKLN